jgi:hypothetical protein
VKIFPGNRNFTEIGKVHVLGVLRTQLLDELGIIEKGSYALQITGRYLASLLVDILKSKLLWQTKAAVDVKREVLEDFVLESLNEVSDSDPSPCCCYS